jgi:hypothetical protein
VLVDIVCVYVCVCACVLQKKLMVDPEDARDGDNLADKASGEGDGCNDDDDAEASHGIKDLTARNKLLLCDEEV